MAAVPEEPHVLEITSATFGDTDFTDFVRSQFNAYLSHNPEDTSWTFQAGNTWFGKDPLPGYWKTTCVVWRNTILLPNGDVVWSDFKRVVVMEDGMCTITFDGYGDSQWIPPSTPENGRYIVSAYWFNKDCTSIAQNICNTQAFDPWHYHGLQFDVSVATLGPDPWTDTGKKQFSLTYGSPVSPGVWKFTCQVASGPNSGWTLELPLLFPPINQPNVYGETTYVTFTNRSIGIDVYPIIYSVDRNVAWDGRSVDFIVLNGSTKDVDLIGRAGLQERGYYYCGFITKDGSQTYGLGTTTVFATSSAMGRPCSIWIQKIDGYLFPCGIDFVTANRPLTYQPRDLRLNIYSVTFGPVEYTNFVRQAYISQTIQKLPTDTVNNWSFKPTSDESGSPSFFGADPFPGWSKACVVIYRVAYCIGQTNGFINGPNDPAPWDPQYKNIAPLHTNQYPVFKDITGFRIATAHGGDTMTFNLLTEQLNQTLTLPSPCPSLFVAAAVWSTRDVTTYVTNVVKQAATNADVTVSVTNNGMGQGFNPADPWYGVKKQCTVLVGYPQTPGNGSTIRWRTIVSSGVYDGWTFTIPRRLPATPPTQSPTGFVSDDKTKPVITEVFLTNLASSDAWPQVVTDAGQVVWDGKRVGNGNQWKISKGQTKSLNLSHDAQCIEGASYGVNFFYSQFTLPPFSGWMIASSKDWWKLNLTYMPAPTYDRPTGYQILKEVVYGGP